MRSCIFKLGRLAICATVIAAGLTAPSALVSEHALAATPSITINPTSATPHATIQITGAGFDPSTQSQIRLVDISVRTNAGTIPVATLQTDGSGQIGMASPQQITLPISLDAPGPDQVLAVEEGSAGVTASASVTGIAVHPQLNGGLPLSGQPGASLDVKGSGFAPGDTLSLTLNGTTLAQQGGQQTITADASGSVDIPFVLPQTATGSQTLVAIGAAQGSGQTDQATVQITLGGAPSTAGLQISPNPAAVGTSLRVTSVGFQPNEPVTFSLQYFDTALNVEAVVNAPTTADSSGLASTVISIPSTADGSKPGTVVGRGINSGFSIAGQVTFAVLAKMVISPPTALPGAQIVITGTGFVPNEAIYVTTRLFKLPLGRFTVADATGSFSITETLFTTLQPGSTLNLAVSGSGGDNATVAFTVAASSTPTVTVAPSTVKAGGSVVISGHAFSVNEGLTFSIAGAQLPVSGTPPLTDGTGAFTATVTVPAALAAGVYDLKVTGLSSNDTATAPLTISGTANQWYFAEGFTGQGPNVFFHETISILNTANVPTTGTIIYQFTDGSSVSIPVSIAAHSLIVHDVNRDIGSNRTFSTVVQTNHPVVTQRTITRTDKSKHVLDTDYSPGLSAPQTTWYFAEGYSGITFQPYLVIQNPEAIAISATVTLYPSKGTSRKVVTTITAGNRATLNLRSILPDRSFGIKVSATGPVVAERVEYWGAGAGSAKFGDGVKPGAATTGKSWYFAFNSVLNGDQAFLSLFNPGTKTAHTQVVLFSGSGSVAGKTSVAVAPGQRATVTVNQFAAKHSPIAAVISSDQALVAEEAQYFAGSPNTGSHAGSSIEGRQTTAHSWSFAAGDTTLYQESEYIFNPSPHQKATVAVTFYGVDHQKFTQTFVVKPLNVITVSANALKGLHAGVHGSVWTSQNSIVVAQSLRGKKSTLALADQGVTG